MIFEFFSSCLNMIKGGGMNYISEKILKELFIHCLNQVDTRRCFKVYKTSIRRRRHTGKL